MFKSTNRELREACIDSLMQLAKEDPDVFLLVGDLGFSFFDKFAQKFPGRFINCGVIEQTMIGIAAGLALVGKKPYVYSTATFLVFRPFEQIRSALCYQNLNIKLIGSSGAQYGFLGFTHNCKNEAIKALKLFPNIEVYKSKSVEDVKNSMLNSYLSQKPTYIEL